MSKSPPAFARRLLLAFLRDDLAEEVLGDLDEKFYSKLGNRSAVRARVNYWYQVFNYLRPFAVRKSRSVQLNHYSMFENYFKIAWRHTLRHKSFSFINVFGLALAMSVVMLIILMLDDQKSYDQFHEKKDRTYRILSKIQRSSTPNASSPFPLALAMREEYPFIEQSTHLVPGVGGDARYQQKAVEMRGYFADAFFFDVFGFELLKGEKSQALGSPNSIVITSEIATRLFGDEDPIGKAVEFSDRRLRLMQLDFGGDTGATPVSWGTYSVTGVIDAARYKSHLKFDALISSASLPTLYREQKVPDRRDDWQTYSWCYTYVVLRPGAREEVLTTSLKELVERKYAGFEDLTGSGLFLSV